MDRTPLKRCAATGSAAIDCQWMRANERLCLRRNAASSNEVIFFVLTTIHVRLVRATKPSNRLNERVEHRFEVNRRPADDLEHVASRGELVDRARELGLALAQFVEEARILD